ncbi:54S ribosomal protein L23 [Drechslerella dactyloides]|uniref:Large ribosomal subunit protein uL13m n=1 Tax=Drechslerella dactyloides TaxID=74499 RepID=A0AAD6IPV6_DREDA|nr:54S ribosomal protein L23 [Drechslerella dactyloides]
MSQVIGRTSLAFSRTWHVLNVAADGRSLGRLATAIAVTLMGKHKPVYDPSNDCGDYVVAIGCNELKLTGNKRYKKMYYKHTTRPGTGFKQIVMDKLIKKFGAGEVLKRAVSGMLPKNRLRDVRLARLRVFEGQDHPYKKNIVVMEAQSNRRGPNGPKYGPPVKDTKKKQSKEPAAAPPAEGAPAAIAT